MGEVLDTMKALVEPTTKLIDAVQSAIGKVYEPYHIRRTAKARAYELTTIGQAIRENSDIPIIYNQGAISIDNSDADEFIKRTKHRITYQELTKQSNIESVVSGAYEMLDGMPCIPNSPINPDWLLRLFDSVQYISDCDMQLYWSKVLAREVLNPGKTSLRTLMLLSQMTSSEAKLFERISKYVLCSENSVASLPDDYFILADENAQKCIGIDFSHIHLLDEVGLISSNALVRAGVDVHPCSSAYIYIVDHHHPIIRFTNNGGTFERIYRQAFILSNAGRELLQVINAPVVMKDITTFINTCFEIYSKNTLMDEPNSSNVKIELLI